MKIGFDAKRLFFNFSGLGNYSRSVVKHYHQLYEEDQITLFVKHYEESKFKKDFLTSEYCIVDGKKKFLWRFKNIVKDIEKQDLDIYHGLSNELPYSIENLSTLYKIVTIHDLIFLKFPEFYPLIDRKIYHSKFRRSCNSADKIIAVSESTKMDIIQFFGIPESKIEVIYQSCDDIFYDKIKDCPFPKYIENEKRPYFLFVSSITKRKNLKNVLVALNLIKPENRPLLVVVGDGGKYKKELEKWVGENNLSRDVLFLGHIKNQELKELYFHAKFSIYPSFYEGFGIPIIESLLCGTPVITSNTSSMPEAGNEIAVLIDPNSVESIGTSIEQLSISSEKISDHDILKIKQKFGADEHAMKLHRLYSKAK